MIQFSSIAYVLKHIVWPRRRLLLLGLFLIVLNRLSSMVMPWGLKYLGDDVIPHRDFRVLRILLAAVGAAVAVQAVTAFFQTRLLSVQAQRLIADLRVRMQKHIIHMSLHFFDNQKAGALVSRIMTDVEGVRNFVGTGVVYMVGGTLSAAGALVLLTSINPALTGIGLIPFVLFAVISFRAYGYIRPIFRKRWELNADVSGRLTESLGGIRVIKGFHAEEREIEVFRKGADSLFANVRKTLTATSLVSSLGSLLMGIASVSIMGLGGLFIIRGDMTMGEFMSFAAFMFFLITPVLQISNIGSQLTESFAGLDRMNEILSLKREGEGEGRSIVLNEITGDLEFRDVYFSYEDEGEKILKNITFHAEPGSVTALVGSSGSGKTTIAGLAASFYTPDHGSVMIDGNDLTSVVLERYRSQLGVVLQDDFLFDGTVRENILFSDPGADREKFHGAVRAAHVDEFTEGFEKGLDTFIGERGVKLSGGQRQRVAIARALLADPRVLILDEATSNLDTMNESLIQESLTSLMKGRTTLVIAHRLSTIRKADQILVVENGVIIERGTHDELIAEEGHYFRMYTYQARI